MTLQNAQKTQKGMAVKHVPVRHAGALLFASLVLFAATSFAQSWPPRLISRTTDVSQISTVDAVEWFSGEQVEYQHRGYIGTVTNRAVYPTNAVAIWFVTDATYTNYFVIWTNSAISNATGFLGFTLPTPFAALTSSAQMGANYESWVNVYAGAPTNGSTPIGVVDRMQIIVKRGASYSGAYRGPSTITNAILNGNTQVEPGFWALYQGELNGLITNPVAGVNSNAITDGGIAFSDLAQNGATNNQVPTWNGTAWVAATPAGGSGGTTNVIFENLELNGDVGTESNQLARGSELAGKLDRNGSNAMTGSLNLGLNNISNVVRNYAQYYDAQWNARAYWQMQQNISGSWIQPEMTLYVLGQHGVSNTARMQMNYGSPGGMRLSLGNPYPGLITDGDAYLSSVEATNYLVVWRLLQVKDANTNAVVTITPTGGVQVGEASLHLYPSGDISQDSTNSAVLGTVIVQRATGVFAGDGSGLTGVPAVSTNVTVRFNNTNYTGARLELAQAGAITNVYVDTNGNVVVQSKDETGVGGGGNPFTNSLFISTGPTNTFYALAQNVWEPIRLSNVVWTSGSLASKWNSASFGVNLPATGIAYAAFVRITDGDSAVLDAQIAWFENGTNTLTRSWEHSTLLSLSKMAFAGSEDYASGYILSPQTILFAVTNGVFYQPKIKTTSAAGYGWDASVLIYELGPIPSLAGGF